MFDFRRDGLRYGSSFFTECSLLAAGGHSCAVRSTSHPALKSIGAGQQNLRKLPCLDDLSRWILKRDEPPCRLNCRNAPVSPDGMSEFCGRVPLRDKYRRRKRARDIGKHDQQVCGLPRGIDETGVLAAPNLCEFDFAGGAEWAFPEEYFR